MHQVPRDTRLGWRGAIARADDDAGDSVHLQTCGVRSGEGGREEFTPTAALSSELCRDSSP